MLVVLAESVLAVDLADAPPVTTSTRSMSGTGIWSMSGATSWFEVLGSPAPRRRALTSTSVRCGPRPRRSIVVKPPVEVSGLEVLPKSELPPMMFCGN